MNPSPIDVIRREGHCQHSLPHLDNYIISKSGCFKQPETLPCKTARKRTNLHIASQPQDVPFSHIHGAVRMPAQRRVYNYLQISV